MLIQLVNNYVVIFRGRLFLDTYSNPFEAYYSSTNDVNIHQEMRSVITFSLHISNSKLKPAGFDF